MMAKPEVNYSVNPSSGSSPLTVNITDLVFGDIADDYDFISQAHLGAIDSNYDLDLEKQAVLGFLISNNLENYTYSWQFGDGESSTQNTPFQHTYSNSGNYTLKLVVTVDGESYEYPTNIVVTSETVSPKSLLQDIENRLCLNFGSNQKEGYGWSHCDGDSFLWPDTNGSAINLFDDEKEVSIVFDSNSSLPYILNVKKDSEFPKLTFHDKEDPLISGSGENIASVVKLEQIKAEEESFVIRPSDLKIYFKPRLSSNKSRDGYTNFGMPDDFKLDVELYLDKAETSISKITDAPLNQELFFQDGKSKEGNIIEYKLSTSASEWIFTKLFADIISNDKALFPFKEIQTSAEYQNTLGYMAYWVTRYSYDFDRVWGGKFFDNSSSFDEELIKGPDNVDQSAVNFTSTYSLLVSYSGLKSVLMWTTVATPIQGLSATIINSVLIGATTWNLVVINNVNDIDVFNIGKYFDIRFFDNNYLDDKQDALLYYYNDVVSNSGGVLCPV